MAERDAVIRGTGGQELEHPANLVSEDQLAPARPVVQRAAAELVEREYPSPARVIPQQQGEVAPELLEERFPLARPAVSQEGRVVVVRLTEAASQNVPVRDPAIEYAFDIADPAQAGKRAGEARRAGPTQLKYAG
jgi:hypothetical protein